MCGFAGWINYKDNILNKKNCIKEMTKSLKYRGPDDTGYHIESHVLLGHQRLSIIDPLNGKQPLSYEDYTIVYNGELYNTNEIRNLLIKSGYTFNTMCDTEVLLKAYIHFKEKVLNILEGIYAFAVIHDNELFLARDRLGVKPLFYSKVANNFIFASEIKAVLKSRIVNPIVDKKGLQELLALGPSKTPGNAIFKEISELKPAHYLIYKDNKIKIKRYWNVKNMEFNDSFNECKDKIKSLVTNAIKDSNILILGYGNIGELLTQKLINLDAKVTVGVKEEKDYIKLNKDNINVFYTHDENMFMNNVKAKNIIINTVPSLLLNEHYLNLIDVNTYILDVASYPYGVDFDYAKKLCLNCKLFLGIPSIVAPTTAGLILSKKIIKMIGGE